MKINNKNKSGRKRVTGKVVSDKMEKTRVVCVQRVLRHSVYEKVVRKDKKYYAHDENNISAKGDEVLIEESRPLSRLKRWRVVEVKK